MVFAALLILSQLVLNILLSREIILWIPSPREKLLLILLLWLFPLLGVVVVWRKVRPDWFQREPGEPGSKSSVSSGLLALDAIFNPGSAHVLDAQKRSEVTIRMEGEMYDRELPDHIDVEDQGNPESKPDNLPEDNP